MSNFLTIFLYILSGFLSGIFGGLGMGGGTLLIPILTIFFSMEQKLSQGINLISFLVMSLIALCIHYKNGYLSLKGTFYIIFSGLLFSCLGAWLSGIMPSKILRQSFGAFLCILSIYQVYKCLKGDKNKKKSSFKNKIANKETKKFTHR